MQAFLIERLFETGWKLEGPVYWTFDLATKEATRMLRRRIARRVRIRPIEVSDASIVELPSAVVEPTVA